MDIDLLVYELQLKLMLQKISFSDIANIFHKKCNEENMINLKGKYKNKNN